MAILYGVGTEVSCSLLCIVHNPCSTLQLLLLLCRFARLHQLRAADGLDNTRQTARVMQGARKHQCRLAVAVQSAGTPLLQRK